MIKQQVVQQKVDSLQKWLILLSLIIVKHKAHNSDDAMDETKILYKHPILFKVVAESYVDAKLKKSY